MQEDFISRPNDVKNKEQCQVGISDRLQLRKTWMKTQTQIGLGKVLQRI
jgi:hypothetical protein